MHRAGAFFAGGKQGRNQQDQHEQQRQADRQGDCFGGGHLIGALQGEAFVKEEDTAQDAAGKSDQTDNGVEVAAADTQNHAQRAAEEGQRADHDESAQKEAGDRSRTALRRKLLADQRHSQRASDKADDFGTEILYSTGGMQLGSSGDVAQKAGDAEAHVFRVAEQNQRDSDQTDDRSGDDNAGVSLFVLHKKHISLSSLTEANCQILFVHT